MNARWIVSLVIWPVLALTAVGQTEDVLNLVPKDALGVIYVNRLDQTDKDFVALTQKLNTPVPVSMVPGLKQLTGANEQLNTKGTMAMIVLPSDQPGVPFNDITKSAVLALPVNNYSKFLKEINAKQEDRRFATATLATGIEVVIAPKTTPKGSFALVVDSKNKGNLEKVLKAKAGFAKTLKTQLTWLTETDAAVVFTEPGVKYTLKGAQDGLDQFGLFLDPTDDQQKVAIKMFDALGKWLNTVNKNATFLAFGVNLNKKNNVTFGVRTGFAKNGSFAKSAKDYNNVKGDPLAGLPNKDAFLSFGAILPKSYQQMIVDIVQMSSEMNQSKLTKAETKELTDILKKQNQFNGIANLITAPQDGTKSVMENFYSFVKVKDTKAYLDYYEKTVKRTQELAAKMNLKDNNMELESTKGMTVDGVRMVQTVQKLQPLNAQDELSLKAMFGDVKKISSCTAVVNKTTLLVSIGSPKAVAKKVKMLRSQKTSLVNRADIKKLYAQLPKGSQWVMTVNPQHLIPYVESIGMMFDPTMPKLPQFPASPPAGMGMRFSQDGMQAEMVLPIPLMENTASFIRKMQALQGL